MSSYTYVDDVNSNLICCVCQAPFINPVVTTCTHTFCKDCILRSLESQPCCPVDRTPLSPDDLRPENLLLRNMVDELIVECTYKPSGCRHTCQRQLLDLHLRGSCQYIRVACSEEGCEQEVLRRDVGKHTHDCVHRVIKCHACGVFVRASDFESHNSECAEQDATCSACMETLKRADFTKHSQQCVEVEVPCMHNDNGCPWTGARKSLTSHLSKCPYEAIKGFFVVNETRLSTLYEENTTLRQKLGNAEATIHSLRRDVDTARRALGPWWKSGDIVAHAPMEEFSEPSTSAQDSQRITEQSRWRAPNHFSPILTFSPESSLVSTTYEGGPFGASAGPSSDPALFASYFPSPSSTNHGDPSSIPAHAGTTLAPADPLARHLFPFSSRGPSGFPPQPTRLLDLPHGQNQMLPRARVAPVDRDTTLEGALCGLRGSAVALSGAIDALARRTDVALTTENLRMNEEVGALRAIVHGLRMQVHALITERNGGNPWGPTTTSSPSYYSHPPPPPHPPLMVNSTAQITKL